MDTDDRSLYFNIRQLQHTFRHADNFGVKGKSNKKTLEKFRVALVAHVRRRWGMNTAFDRYSGIIERFLSRQWSAQEFSDHFLEAFKNEN